MWDLVYKQLGVPQRKVTYIAIICINITLFQKASGWMGDPPVPEPGEYWSCMGLIHVCSFVPHMTGHRPRARCKSPKPSNQERNKVQISFLFSRGFCYLYVPNGKEGSVLHSLELYIKLCHLTFKCQIILLK